MPLQTYQNYYPWNQDMEFLKRIWKEYYLRFPILMYKSVDDVLSTPHQFYLDASREDRKYTEYQTHFRVSPDATEDQNLINTGIDVPKTILFLVCYPYFQEMSLEPKIGDVVMFEFQEPIEYEVRTVRKPQDSHFANSNYFFERELKADRIIKGK